MKAFLRRTVPKRPTRFVGYALALAATAMWSGNFIIARGLSGSVPPVTFNFSPAAIGAIAYLGVGPSLPAFLCWNEAILRIGPVRSGFVYDSLPVFSGAEALALPGEPVHAFHAFSGVLILLGVITAVSEPG